MNLSPINIDGRFWLLGVIENHTARPLTRDEIEQHIKDHEGWREHAALSDKEYLQLSDWLIGNADFDPKTGLIDHAAKLKERIRDLIAKEGELGDLRSALINLLNCEAYGTKGAAWRSASTYARSVLSASQPAPLPSPTKLSEARSADTTASTAPATDAGASLPASGDSGASV
jgi:hypothetical protein